MLGETITCPWHGWRFDLRSGTCLTAGEDARSYRVELRGDEVWVELDVEPSDAERERLREVLISAVEAGDADRAARAVVRLLGAGAAHADIVAPVARFAATHGECARSGGRGAGRRARAAPMPRRTALRWSWPTRSRPWPSAWDAPRRASRPSRAARWRSTTRARRWRRAWPSATPTEPRRSCAACWRAARTRKRSPAWSPLAASARFRGPLPLALAERAARLAELGDDVARPVLAAAARAAAGGRAAGRRRALRRPRPGAGQPGRAGGRSGRVAAALRRRARIRRPRHGLAAGRGRGARVPARRRLERRRGRHRARPLAGRRRPRLARGRRPRQPRHPATSCPRWPAELPPRRGAPPSAWRRRGRRSSSAARPRWRASSACCGRRGASASPAASS